MNKIISIICPHCQERQMIYDPQKRAFECYKCVFRYPADWFNFFKTFEHLVTRVEDTPFGRPIENMEVANGTH